MFFSLPSHPRFAVARAICVFALAAAGWTETAALTATADEPPLGAGQPLVQRFTPRDYHGSEQCWGIVQDTRGLMYIGNKGFVLEYDGATWRKVPVGGEDVFGLAVEASTNTVFVGGTDDLGYLKLDPDGTRVFVSLLDLLPADRRDVGQVRRVYATEDGIFFAGRDQVMRWRGGRFTVWKIPVRGRLVAGWVNGTLYVQNPAAGLQRLQNEAFVPASTDPIFGQTLVLSMAAAPDGSLLAGTLHDGLLTVRDGAVRPWQGDLGAFFKAQGITQLLRLGDGSLAVGTVSGGVVTLDPAGRFLGRLDESGGLHPGPRTG